MKIIHLFSPIRPAKMQNEAFSNFDSVSGIGEQALLITHSSPSVDDAGSGQSGADKPASGDSFSS